MNMYQNILKVHIITDLRDIWKLITANMSGK